MLINASPVCRFTVENNLVKKIATITREFVTNVKTITYCIMWILCLFWLRGNPEGPQFILFLYFIVIL